MRFIFFCFSLFIVQGTCHAQPVKSDVSEIRRVINSQLVALGQGDAEKAFSTASPEVQNNYRSANNFMYMIKTLYNPLLYIREWRFQDLLLRSNSPIQIINFTGRSGVDWIAAYKMVQLDGVWKIDNVILGEIEGQLI